jgi:hypothetical protein
LDGGRLTTIDVDEVMGRAGAWREKLAAIGGKPTRAKQELSS